MRTALSIALISPFLGCASAQVAAQDDNVQVADTTLLASIDVEPDQLIVPAAGNDALLSLPAGTIYVGAGGGATTKNPLGFIRRVTSVTSTGDTIVIATTPAALTDAIEDGDLDTTSMKTALIDLPGLMLNYSNRGLYSNVDNVDGVNVNETLTLVTGTLQGTPSINVGASISGFELKSFKAEVAGELDADLQLELAVQADSPFDPSGLAPIGHEAHVPLYDSGKVALPAVWIGAIPVQLSVEFTLSLDCSLGFDGQFDATAGFSTHNKVAIDAEYANGAWQPPVQASVNIVPTFAMTGSANITGQCSVSVTASLGLFEVAQASMKFSPHIDANVEVSGSDYSYTITPGANAWLSGDLSVLGFKASTNAQILDWESQSPLQGTGP